MNQKNLQQYNAEDVVPHTAPMVLINQILEHGDKDCVADVVITKDSLFLENNAVPSWVGIEYMAQTIAAHAGIQGRKLDQPPKIGFLVSSRVYEPEISEFPLGSSLLVKIAETYVDNGFGVYNCSISLDDRVVVEAVLNVFQPEDASEFIKSMNL